ncbi:MAG: ATP-binding protein [Dehalococcoidales bacterium]|nr:ATP-binding protein [Dehalococcoidales bacterium]
MIISVASGKGGTGKTLVATSLAISLKDRESVQLLDCDVEEPNDHVLLQPIFTRNEAVCIPVPKIDEKKCTYCGKCVEICAYHALVVFPKNVLVFPQLCHGCGACSYLCPEKAISEEMREIGIVESGNTDSIKFAQGKLNVGEAMSTPVIRMVKSQANNSGIVIIDVSPGTSCPVVESVKNSDFCILVTEPTPFGLNDLALAVETMRELKIPCGIVLNRVGLDYSGVEEYCHKENLPILLTIPLDMEIARNYSNGITMVQGMPQWKESFLKLFEEVQEIVSERSHCIKR